jgi:hypothetical protein
MVPKIIIDDNGEIINKYAWGTIWYEFTTEKIAYSPMTFNLGKKRVFYDSSEIVSPDSS